MNPVIAAKSPLDLAWAAGFADWHVLQPYLIGLIAMMLLDVVTGVLASVQKDSEGNRPGLDSSISSRGLIRKAGMLLCLSGLLVIDALVPFPLALAFTSLFIGSEGLSLIENFAKLGIPVPAAFSEWLSKLKGTVPVIPVRVVEPLPAIVAPVTAPDPTSKEAA